MVTGVLLITFPVTSITCTWYFPFGWFLNAIRVTKLVTGLGYTEISPSLVIVLFVPRCISVAGTSGLVVLLLVIAGSSAGVSLSSTTTSSLGSSFFFFLLKARY